MSLEGSRPPAPSTRLAFFDSRAHSRPVLPRNRSRPRRQRLLPGRLRCEGNRLELGLSRPVGAIESIPPIGHITCLSVEHWRCGYRWALLPAECNALGPRRAPLRAEGIVLRGWRHASARNGLGNWPSWGNPCRPTAVVAPYGGNPNACRSRISGNARLESQSVVCQCQGLARSHPILLLAAVTRPTSGTSAPSICPSLVRSNVATVTRTPSGPRSSANANGSATAGYGTYIPTRSRSPAVPWHHSPARLRG